MTAPAACAACNHHVRCVSTAIDAPEAASADPCISQRVDDTFRKAQTERRATQLLTPGERSSPSQLDQPSRRGCGAVPSRWASRVLPGASGAKKRLAAEPRARRSRLTKIFCSRQDHKRPYGSQSLTCSVVNSDIWFGAHTVTRGAYSIVPHCPPDTTCLGAHWMLSY